MGNGRWGDTRHRRMHGHLLFGARNGTRLNTVYVHVYGVFSQINALHYILYVHVKKGPQLSPL